VYYSNRAQLHLLWGNNRSAYKDATDALKCDEMNVKAMFRGAKASRALGELKDALDLLERGLKIDSKDPAFNKELALVEKMLQDELRKAQDAEDKKKYMAESNKYLKELFMLKSLKMGKLSYSGYDDLKEAISLISETNELSWAVLFLYEEHSQCDVVQNFLESHTFHEQLSVVFEQPAPWDARHDYTMSSIEVYFECNEAELDPELCDLGRVTVTKKKGWQRVNLNSKLLSILQNPNYIIPGYPVFHIVSKSSPARASILASHKVT